jgi:hypothetical protein
VQAVTCLQDLWPQINHLENKEQNPGPFRKTSTLKCYNPC